MKKIADLLYTWCWGQGFGGSPEYWPQNGAEGVQSIGPKMGLGRTGQAIMMETDRNEEILAEILADSGSESDDNTGSSSDDSIEENSAAFQEVRK